MVPDTEGSDPSNGRAESKEDLAEDRTDWAHERTLLAKQRTFAAWLRTGLTSVAVGFGAAQLLGDLEPQWLVQTGSVLVMLAGAAIFVIGFLGYRSTFKKLKAEGVFGMSPWVIGVVTFAMLLTAAIFILGVVGE